MSASSGLADPVQFAASDPLSAPDWLSPEGIHEYLLRAHTISNEIRFKFIQALRALDEGRFFHSLGFPTMWAYAEEFFGWERSTTYEALQVARALDDLPLTRDRFIGGLAYTRVHQITRIATRETEAEWIEFAELFLWAPFRAASHDPCGPWQARRRAYRGHDPEAPPPRGLRCEGKEQKEAPQGPVLAPGPEDVPPLRFLPR